MEFQAAGAVMVICVALALMSGIVGLCVACGQRPNKRGEALLFGIGLPIVFLGVAHRRIRGGARRGTPLRTALPAPS